MRTPASRLALALLVTAVIPLNGCRSRGAPAESGVAAATSPRLTLDRGDWLVGRRERIYRALEESGIGGAAKPLGFVTERSYREVRGGPAFSHWEVTTLDRNDVIGTVDALGNATRIEPGVAGQLNFVPAGNNTLILGVQAIFRAVNPIRLVETSERAIAFDALDANHDGMLDASEFPRLHDRVGNPDKNGDGKVDRNEFEDADL